MALPFQKVPDTQFIENSSEWLEQFEMSGIYDKPESQNTQNAALGACRVVEAKLPYYSQTAGLPQVSDLSLSEDPDYQAGQNSTGRQLADQTSSEAIDVPFSAKNEKKIVVSPEALKKIDDVFNAEIIRQLKQQNNSYAEEHCIDSDSRCQGQSQFLSSSSNSLASDPNFGRLLDNRMSSEAIDVPFSTENEEKFVITPETLRKLEEILEADVAGQLEQQENAYARECCIDSDSSCLLQSQYFESSSNSRESDPNVGKLQIDYQMCPNFSGDTSLAKQGAVIEFNHGYLEDLMDFSGGTESYQQTAPLPPSPFIPLIENNFADENIFQTAEMPDSIFPRLPDSLDLASGRDHKKSGRSLYDNKNLDTASSNWKEQTDGQSQWSLNVLKKINKAQDHTSIRSATSAEFSAHKGGEALDGNSTAAPTVGKRGGRPLIEYDNLTPDDRERLRLKRAKNKEAAARCRQRKVELFQSLTDQVGSLEGHKRKMLEEATELLKQKEELEFLLEAHQATCKKRSMFNMH